MNNDNSISNYELDILREIGNIGAGNAATALSQILNKKVDLEVPLAELSELSKIPDILGGADAVRTGIFFGVKQALSGYIFFILKDEDADMLHKLAAGDYDIDKTSVLQEISNIISASYVNAIATMINEIVDITPPEVCRDMLGSLLDSIISSLYSVGDTGVLIKTTLSIEEEVISGYFVFLLEKDSLTKLLNFFKGV